MDASYNATRQNPSNTLKTFKLTGEYSYRRSIGGSLGFFDTSGSTDSLLYPSVDATGAALQVVGSASHSPDSRGYIGEVNYLPFLNIKLQLQYTRYTKFNGLSNNYDGAGRNASDNDTLYMLGWINF